jgi:hypothetical protein
MDVTIMNYREEDLTNDFGRLSPITPQHTVDREEWNEYQKYLQEKRSQEEKEQDERVNDRQLEERAISMQEIRNQSIIEVGKKIRRERIPSMGSSTPRGSVKAYERLEKLQDFYITRKLAMSLIKEEVPRYCNSPEMRAQWAIGQWREAANQLKLTDYMEKWDGTPSIPEMREYYDAFIEPHRSTCISMKRVIEHNRRLSDIAVLQHTTIAERTRDSWNIQLEGKTYDQAQVDAAMEVKKLDNEILKMEDRIATIMDDANKAAAKQRTEDMNALANYKESIQEIGSVRL